MNLENHINQDAEVARLMIAGTTVHRFGALAPDAYGMVSTTVAAAISPAVANQVANGDVQTIGDFRRALRG